MGIKDFADSATGFTKSPLGIIALFIVLVYGFASLVVGFGQENLKENVTPLVYFMVTFPVKRWRVGLRPSTKPGPAEPTRSF